MKAYEIYNIIDRIAPFSNQCEFDNAGFLVGDKNSEINSVIVSLDCTNNVINCAKENNANLIVTHHPIIFDALKSVTEQSIVYNLIKNGISVISAHTNLDFSNGGINDILCKLLSLKNIKKFNEFHNGVFELRVGVTDAISADDYAKKLKEIFGLPIKYVDGMRPIKAVAVCSGSGGSFIYDAVKNGADALITADIKHNQFLEASQMKISLFECGHFNTEDIIIEPLAKKLRDETKLKVLTYHGKEIKYC